MTVSIDITTDISDCLALRMEVFVKEQNVPVDEEMDDMDDQSVHLIARDSDGVPVGTARVYEAGDIGKIGRVCVVKSHRGTGLGARLIEACIQEISTRPHLKLAKLGAQNHAIKFYEKLAFSVVGDEYMDGGIPHHDMVRSL
jgi:predicted GNAT family N-acyltransferase